MWVPGPRSFILQFLDIIVRTLDIAQGLNLSLCSRSCLMLLLCLYTHFAAGDDRARYVLESRCIFLAGQSLQAVVFSVMKMLGEQSGGIKEFILNHHPNIVRCESLPHESDQSQRAEGYGWEEGGRTLVSEAAAGAKTRACELEIVNTGPCMTGGHPTGSRLCLASRGACGGRLGVIGEVG